MLDGKYLIEIGLRIHYFYTRKYVLSDRRESEKKGTTDIKM